MSDATISSATTIWDRVLGAVDQSRASVDAARMAARLMRAGARLTLCAVVSQEALDDGPVGERALTAAAEDALNRAQAQIEPLRDTELHLREGPPIRRLLDELQTERATLVTIGRQGQTGAAHVGLGSVATAMLHDAPCSVLIAGTREHADGEVVVGFDGSGAAHRALAAGRELSGRLSLKLRVVVATGDTDGPGPGWSREDLGAEIAVSEDPRTAVEALADASYAAMLLILGSRHLPAALALSSVSEQAAHRATCPVLEG